MSGRKNFCFNSLLAAKMLGLESYRKLFKTLRFSPQAINEGTCTVYDVARRVNKDDHQNDGH